MAGIIARGTKNRDLTKIGGKQLFQDSQFVELARLLAGLVAAHGSRNWRGRSGRPRGPHVGFTCGAFDFAFIIARRAPTETIHPP